MSSSEKKTLNLAWLRKYFEVFLLANESFNYTNLFINTPSIVIHMKFFDI